ncbi:MAG: hypothetical protein P1V97_12910 [Planctomycetota bacterium]|nr:hypothetical protein [Planctomycetota bacterium]
MFILSAMAIGALVGGVAGLITYTVKSKIKKEPFQWKAAVAHTVGGVVGGGLFAPIMAGLGAVGMATVPAYILAGGISWGGIWSFAQDYTSEKLGLENGVGPFGKYLKATAVGVLVSALLTPAAMRVIKPGVGLTVRESTTRAFLGSPGAHARNLVKAEAEFLAFGAAAETINGTIDAADKEEKKTDASQVEIDEKSETNQERDRKNAATKKPARLFDQLPLKTRRASSWYMPEQVTKPAPGVESPGMQKALGELQED